MIFIYNRIGGIFIAIGLLLGILLVVFFNNLSAGLFGVAITWIVLGMKKFRTPEGNTFRGTLFFIPLFVWGFAVMALAFTSLQWNAELEEKKKDPRFVMLEEDCKTLCSQQYSGEVSVAKNLSKHVQEFVNEAAEPRSFHYLVKSDESKVLVLLRVPKLHKIKRDQRDQLFTLIERILMTNPENEHKQLYIGLHGDSSIGGAQTPKFTGVGLGVGRDELMAYYGTAPLAIETAQR